jgi:hypothetical protein
MKAKYLLVLIMTIGVVMVSCKKDDDDDDNNGNSGTTPNTGQGTMTLKVDGVDWSATLAVQATNSNGVLTVAGSDSNAQQCQVTIMNASGTGTYQLGGTPTNPNSGRWTKGTGQNDTYTTMLGIGSGTVTITELTANSVKGTFEFTAKNTPQEEVSITDGSFSATF